ncbi:folylpolyglutamate synthase [Steccherinum ochraceum]|uniref:Folylpolyglutamate synthase n=1 Tax=Steccherinum ochraceum TaxID=92696 RepID=A0A4R0RTS1_9APHY|nr:folylpolyglutamate synthase [Steccherinum ochraceum]
MSIDLSLDRIQILFTHLPRYDRPTCHIAGTNGKGSVSALLTSIFRSSTPPYRVGRYNSPHLVSIYDCITIDDVPVSQEVYKDARARVEKANGDHAIGATSFEVLTLTALQIFQDLQVDIAVVEVGMGGRLDATNVIPDDCILVSALTAVDLDHQAFLGNTVTEITREKAGIARAGKPLILALQPHSSVNLVVQEACDQAGAELVQAIVPSIRPWDDNVDGVRKLEVKLTPEHFIPPTPQPIQISLRCFSVPLQASLPLQGEHQLDNLGTALSMVSTLLTDPANSTLALNLRSRITQRTVQEGIRSTVWNGRLSFHRLSASPGSSRSEQGREDLLVLADGAHNPASSATLASYVAKVFAQTQGPRSDRAPRTITLSYMLALSHSPPKTPLQTLSPLLPPTIPVHEDVTVKINVALLRFTPPEGMPWVKSVPPSELRDVVAARCPGAQIWSAADDAALDGQLAQALEWIKKQHAGADGAVGEGVVVVAGSLYLVADFYRLLPSVAYD